MYYANKLKTLQDLFGTSDISLEETALRVGASRYPIVQDVIILSTDAPKAEDIQFTFGKEWQTYSQILPDHRQEFFSYFDLIDLADLAGQRVCDLGCGMGRWSYFVKDYCREIILVDFSNAIFVARNNLKESDNALFFQCDLKRLPFRDQFADFLFCLGVLHHLPTPCLQEVRALKRAAPKLLIFLYYALDNRPWYFRVLLIAVSAVRLAASRVRNERFRRVFSWSGTWLVYVPLVQLGKVLDLFGLGKNVPLYDFYHDKSIGRIEQDVYDRFFTRIEQRVSRREILELRDSFERITVSERFPYWHFVCENGPGR